MTVRSTLPSGAPETPAFQLPLWNRAVTGRGSMKGSFRAIGLVTQTFFTPLWVWMEWTQPCYNSGSQIKPWG